MEKLLQPIREKYGLPALAASVVLDGKPGPAGAVGVRKYGSDVQVTAQDQFHLGSCTKAMTATLTGMLVEEGKLGWDSTLETLLPDLKEKMRPAWRDVTVEMLLAHRTGLPEGSAPKGKTNLDLLLLPGTPREQRRTYVELFLRDEPANPPGKKFVYSNAGYTLLGAISERLWDLPWETVIARRLFEPLEMTTAGFGAMGTLGKIDQPWQHTGKGKETRPIPPSKLSDNPDVIAPAGKVHCSVGDWAKFVALHVTAGGKLLKPETIRKLHTPGFHGDYAGGWIVVDRPWGGGTVLTHEGSNTMTLAVAWAAPLKRFAVMVATNRMADNSAQACDDVASGLIEQNLGA